MLILSRELGQQVRVGDATITIIRIGQAGVRIGIDAPADVPIVRTELPPLASADSGLSAVGLDASTSDALAPNPDSRIPTPEAPLDTSAAVG
mgnify:CR=1 FL=1